MVLSQDPKGFVAYAAKLLEAKPLGSVLMRRLVSPEDPKGFVAYEAKLLEAKPLGSAVDFYPSMASSKVLASSGVMMPCSTILRIFSCSSGVAC